MALLIIETMHDVTVAYEAGNKKKSVKSDATSSLGNSHLWTSCIKLLTELQKQS